MTTPQKMIQQTLRRRVTDPIQSGALQNQRRLGPVVGSHPGGPGQLAGVPTNRNQINQPLPHQQPAPQPMNPQPGYMNGQIMPVANPGQQTPGPYPQPPTGIPPMADPNNPVTQNPGAGPPGGANRPDWQRTPWDNPNAAGATQFFQNHGWLYNPNSQTWTFTGHVPTAQQDDYQRVHQGLPVQPPSPQPGPPGGQQPPPGPQPAPYPNGGIGPYPGQNPPPGPPTPGPYQQNQQQNGGGGGNGQGGGNGGGGGGGGGGGNGGGGGGGQQPPPGPVTPPYPDTTQLPNPPVPPMTTLPLDPQYEMQQRGLEDQLALAMQGLTNSQQQALANQQLQQARLGTNQGIDDRALREQLVGRGMYNSSEKGTELGNLGTQYLRQYQDLGNQTAGSLSDIASQQGAAQLAYSQGLQQALLDLANRESQDPYAVFTHTNQPPPNPQTDPIPPLPKDTGGGGGGGRRNSGGGGKGKGGGKSKRRNH